MFEQAAAVGVGAVARRGQAQQLLRVPVEQVEDEGAVRLVGDVRLGQGPQFAEQERRLLGRHLDKVGGVEAVGRVALLDGAQVHQLDLRAVALVFGVDGAQLVELAGTPLVLGLRVPAVVAPGHERDGAPGVGEAAVEIGPALARRAARCGRGGSRRSPPAGRGEVGQRHQFAFGC